MPKSPLISLIVVSFSLVGQKQGKQFNSKFFQHIALNDNRRENNPSKALKYHFLQIQYFILRKIEFILSLFFKKALCYIFLYFAPPMTIYQDVVKNGKFSSKMLRKFKLQFDLFFFLHSLRFLSLSISSLALCLFVYLNSIGTSSSSKRWKQFT